jgi:hypothetical protein
MRKKRLDASEQRHNGRRPSLSTRLETVRYITEIRSSSGDCLTTPLQQIAEALVQAGHRSLDDQARALGIHRSTTWTIIKTKHKLGRLSAKTTKRILANPNTPPSVRAIVAKYLAERSKVFDASQPKVEQIGHRPGYKN